MIIVNTWGKFLILTFTFFLTYLWWHLSRHIIGIILRMTFWFIRLHFLVFNLWSSFLDHILFLISSLYDRLRFILCYDLIGVLGYLVWFLFIDACKLVYCEILEKTAGIFIRVKKLWHLFDQILIIKSIEF